MAEDAVADGIVERLERNGPYLSRRLVATAFHRWMKAGRTSPLLCRCEDESGKVVGDYVLKLRGGINREAGLLAEWLASELAVRLGLTVPEPALIIVDQAFANSVSGDHPAKRELLEKSTGLSFGSRYLTELMPWPVGERSAGSMEA